MIPSSVKRFIFICSFCILLLCFRNRWPQEIELSTNSQTDTSKNVTTILLWNWPFRQQSGLKGDVCWDLYQIPRCKLVDQRSFFPSADVVVFHNRELIDGSQKLPTHLPRPSGQRWAWMSLESPAHNGNLKHFANIFNMTMSYRRDADITIPYGKLVPRKDEGPVVEESPGNKSSLVCWVVSNYQRYHRRSLVYKELSALVPVKVYGTWTKTPLSSADLLPTISSCYFYLSFENSEAKDYITEKLWKNGYQGGAVPVVLGPPISDYEAVAPNTSFIHVDQFKSVKEMASYLQHLAEDKKQYSEYFKWKRQWRVELHYDWRERLCQICPRYDSLRPNHVYSNLQAWVNDEVPQSNVWS
ncbi:alpha-(1,3)-fucosyltransferase 7 isoform 2-T3 [Menidia menidia]